MRGESQSGLLLAVMTVHLAGPWTAVPAWAGKGPVPAARQRPGPAHQWPVTTRYFRPLTSTKPCFGHTLSSNTRCGAPQPGQKAAGRPKPGRRSGGDAMTAPEDAERVLTAIRLGWAMAEVRGRNRPDAPPGAKAALPGPPSGALPLRAEQTPTELRIEVQSLLGVMAHDLRLDRGKDHTDFPKAIDDQAKRLYEARKTAAGAGIAMAPGEAGAAVSGGAGPGGAVAVGSPAVPGAAVDGMAVDGVATPDGATPDGAGPVVMVAAGETPAATAVPGDPAAEWLSLQELIFKFDQHIQNTLAWGLDTVVCGYQFGRALAEPYWALDPGLPDKSLSPAAWWFLLGEERSGEMSRLAGRLTAYFHPLTAAAIAGSVQIWKHVAADPVWREDARDELFF